MCARRSPIARRPPTSRSRVSNGSALLLNGDQRSAGARRFRDLVEAFSADLGDDLSEADLAMVKTAAGLALKSELLHADLAAGKEVDADILIKLAGTARRSMAALSVKALERKPATSMSFIEFAAQRAAELAAQADDDTDEPDDEG